MAKLKSKLFRNLKPGDRFEVYTDESTHVSYRAIVTVARVERLCTQRLSAGKVLHQYRIHGTYPWWWPRPIDALSDERTTLYTGD